MSATCEASVCRTCLSRRDIVGLAIATVPGFVSSLAVLILLCIIFRNFIRFYMNIPRKEWRLFKSPLDVYMFSLLVSDFLQGFGKVLNLRWLHLHVVHCGRYCTTQGAFQQVGEAGVAQATLAIAVHTFIIIFFRRGSRSLRTSIFVVACIWCYVLLFPILGASLVPHYITPTPFWCWISEKEDAARLAGEYVWLWIAALTSFALYVPLYLQLRGYIYISPLGDKWYQIRVKTNFFKKRDSLPESVSAVPSRDAYIMLLYPASYFFLVLPDSIIRWMAFNNIAVPTAATFFATCVFGLSGIVNVLSFMVYTAWIVTSRRHATFISIQGKQIYLFSNSLDLDE